jgi:hypothetical protein
MKTIAIMTFIELISGVLVCWTSRGRLISVGDVWAFRSRAFRSRYSTQRVRPQKIFPSAARSAAATGVAEVDCANAGTAARIATALKNMSKNFIVVLAAITAGIGLALSRR